MNNIQTYPRKKKRKSKNMVVNDIKISLKMKNKCWLSIEKNYEIRENRNDSY